MGVGLISLGTLDDLGRGPDFTVWESGRKVRADAVVTLDNMLRHGELVKSQHPNHAVIFAVKPQAISVASLVRNMDDDEDQEPHRVVWIQEFIDKPHQLIMCNGELRHTWVSMYCIRDALAAYQRAQYSLTLASGDAFMHQDQYKKLCVKAEEARDLVEEKSLWLARYYNVGKSVQVLTQWAQHNPSFDQTLFRNMIFLIKSWII